MFYLCATLAVFNLGAEVYLLANGVHQWPPIIMTVFWLFLAWGHARQSK